MLNRTILAGRLIAAPEVRYTHEEKAICLFRLMITNNADERQTINCVASGGLAKICGEYLSKGKLVAIEGRINIRSFKNNKGEAKSDTEILVEKLQMLDSKFCKATEKMEGK